MPARPGHLFIPARVSRTLPKISRKWGHGVGNASIRPARWRNRRTLFERTQQRRVRQPIGFEHGDKPVPSAHGLYSSLLSRAKYFDRQSFEVAENPQQVKSLRERRIKIPWSQRRENSQNALGQLFHPHDRVTLHLQFLMSCLGPEQSKGQHYCTKCYAKGSRILAFPQIFIGAPQKLTHPGISGKATMLRILAANPNRPSSPPGSTLTTEAWQHTQRFSPSVNWGGSISTISSSLPTRISESA